MTSNEDRDVYLAGRLIQWGLRPKAIPFNDKRWESYVGIGLGVQNAHTEVSWTGATEQNGLKAHPTLTQDDKNAFLTSVRGGLRYMPVSWVGVQLNLKVIPIAKIFNEDVNYLELNAGVFFHF